MGLFKKKDPLEELNRTLGKEEKSNFPNTEDYTQDRESNFPRGIPEFGMNVKQESKQQASEEHPDLRLVNAKLDAIKSELDNINLRLKSIEQFSLKDEKKQKLW